MNGRVRREKHYVKLLQKRAAWLEQRIAEADAKGKNLDWDKHEASALRWAIQQIEFSNADFTSVTAKRETERESLESIDATPDEGYVLRILQAHLDANTRSTITDNMEGKPPTSPLCVAMNEAAAERAELLREAIDRLRIGMGLPPPSRE